MTVDVSVIITAYNVERYIARAIRSALDQTGPAAEVIVIDDCSTDGTWAVISGINDTRLKCLQLSKNGGPSIARNAGIAQATGTWIAVLDGDDAFQPGRLERCLNRAAGLKADIVVDNLSVVHETGGAALPMFPPSRFSLAPTLDLAKFIAGNQSFMGGYTLGYLKPVFSAEFLRQHKLFYDPDIHIGEDYIIMAEALACGAVCAVEPSAGYLYTVRACSISHRLAPDDILRISACDKKFLARHALDPAARKAQRRREFSIRETYAFTLLVDAIKQKNIREIFRTIAQCPTAIRYLWLPVKVRLVRWIGVA